MVFKRGNPGCPCCDCPCACYKFDGNANDSVSGKHLTATNASYSAGKLDKAATMSGSTYFKGDDHACYEVGAEGLAVWFWFKGDTACTSGPGSSTPHLEGVVTKSIWDIQAGLGNPSLSGEWGVYWHNLTSPGGGDFAGLLYFVAKPTNVAGGGIDYITIPLGGAAWADAIFVSEGFNFYYFWISISENKMYLIVNGGVTQEKAAPVGESFTASSGQDLYVGNNLGKAVLGSQAVGAVANRTFHIDNLGFCKDIGPEAEMTARAAELYNSGNGLACNNSGR